MRKHMLYGFTCMVTAAMLLSSFAGIGALEPERNTACLETGTLHSIQPESGVAASIPEPYLDTLHADYEDIFTAPFDYVDNDTFWDVDPGETEKWSNISYADDTGLCRLNVSAVDVSEWGEAGAFAAVGGTTMASRTYEKPTAEFFFSGVFKLFDDIQLASKTQITAYYFYYEDDEILNAGELQQWRQDTDSDEYTIDYTENPLSVELDAYRSGETYTLVILFEAYIEATGGSGTCYIDACNASIGRQITVDKIRLYDACEWGADLEVSEYSLDWSEVRPGSMHNGSIRLRNAGTHCSRLDWEVIAWPDWG
ncbi:MAG: hypothetical protein ACP5FL_03730, partial [Thermoplasmatota archaeon]